MGFIDYIFKVSYVKLFLGLSITIYESFINSLMGKEVMGTNTVNMTQIKEIQQQSNSAILKLFSFLPDFLKGTLDAIVSVGSALANFIKDLLYNTVFSFKKMMEIFLIQFLGQDHYNTVANVPFVHNFLNVLTLFDVLTTVVIMILIYQLARGQTYI
jgi:hypothetical protein